MTRLLVVLSILPIAVLPGCASRHATAPPLSADRGRGTASVLGSLLVNPENRAYTEEHGFPEYVVGVGDVLRISIWKGTIEERQSVEIQVDGTISLPYVRGVHVGGQTVRQVASTITKQLSPFVKKPAVSVAVESYNSKLVSVAGAIALPTGRKSGYGLEGKTRLLDLVNAIGVPSPGARTDRVSLVRGGQSVVLDLRRVWEYGDSTQNPILESGDAIYVPWGSEKRVFVTGEVQRPGVYLLSGDGTVLEAVMQAGGLTSRAAKNGVRVVRPGESAATILPVSLGDIMKGEELQGNIRVEQGDVVYVPKTAVGSVSTVLSTINSFLTPLIFFTSIYRFR